MSGLEKNPEKNVGAVNKRKKGSRSRNGSWGPQREDRKNETARNALRVKGESWPSGSSVDRDIIRFGSYPVLPDHPSMGQTAALNGESRSGMMIAENVKISGIDIILSAVSKDGTVLKSTANR